MVVRRGLCVSDGRRVEIAREHLDHVTRLEGAALAAGLAGHVHQAAEIAGEDQIGAGGGDVAGLVADHDVGDVGVLDAERAAEAAADVVFHHLAQFQSFDRAEERAGLGLDAEAAQARAAVVIGDGNRRRDGDGPHAEHVGQERGDLVGLGAERRRAGAPGVVGVEHFGIVLRDGGAAGPGGDDDVIVALESVDDLAGDVAGGGGVAGIPSRLAAAGLGVRNLDVAARVGQELDRREADRRPEHVHKAGDEKRDARTGHADSLKSLCPVVVPRTPRDKRRRPSRLCHRVAGG